jgi:hypothetical protein
LPTANSGAALRILKKDCTKRIRKFEQTTLADLEELVAGSKAERRLRLSFNT